MEIINFLTSILSHPLSVVVIVLTLLVLLVSKSEKIDFEIVKKQKLSEITLKEFISKLEAERKRRNDIMKKRLPKGVQIESSTSTNHSIELKYEWEKK